MRPDNRHVDQQPLLEGARQIVEALQSAGYAAYLVGGAVRDQLLGRPFREIDIATSATPQQIEQVFNHIEFVGKSFGVALVKQQGIHYEVATFRQDGNYSDARRPDNVMFTESPELDAARRDFTINALFYDPLQDRVLDFVDGQADLRAGLIRAVGEPDKRFAEDRLRVLRAIRFAARYRFEIEPNTWQALRKWSTLVQDISPERIQAELTMILTQPHADQAFRKMAAAGLLNTILPEVQALLGVAQPEQFHPEGDVFEHTMLMLRMLEQNDPVLAWAVLCHDIGKPPTYSVSDRIRFNGHDKTGMEMFRRLASRLRFSNQDTEDIAWLIAGHMRISHIKKMREAKRIRLMRERLFPKLLELHRLDCLASHAKLDLYEFCQEEFGRLSSQDLKPAPFLTGTDLIELGVKPGPRFKEILEDLEDRQLEGELQDRASACRYVRQHYLGESHEHV